MHLFPPGRWRAAFFFSLFVVALSSTSCIGTEGPFATLSPASDFAQIITDIWVLLNWLGIIVGVGVIGVLIYLVLRYRRRPDDGIPPQVHGSTPLEIAWTIIPALILVVIAVPTIRAIFATQQPQALAEGAPPPLEVQVIGHQWWWEVRYPGLNIVSANEIHVPVGRPVIFMLSTADVIHSFWVPRLGGKRDLIPNHPTNIFMTPLEPGLFFGQCAEFCGIQHAKMRLRVVVHPQGEFDAWVRQTQEPSPPTTALPPLAQQGQQIFMTGACAGCHAIEGTPAQARIGPDLTHFGSRLTIAAGVLENTPENLALWLRNPQAVKVGNKMPNLSLTEEQIAALVAYLESLQ